MYDVIVATGESMEPTYTSSYYYILVVKIKDEYDINDIVAYSDGSKKVHRIVGTCSTKDRDYYILKPDAEVGYYTYIDVDNVKGKVVASVPIPFI